MFVCFLKARGDEQFRSIWAKFQSMWVNTVMMHSPVECKPLCPMDVKSTETNGSISRYFHVSQNKEPERLYWLFSHLKKQNGFLFCFSKFILGVGQVSCKSLKQPYIMCNSAVYNKVRCKTMHISILVALMCWYIFC